MNAIKNPLYCYAIAFSVALLIYNFGWSSFYPELSLDLQLFLAITIAIAVFIGWFLTRLGFFAMRDCPPIRVRHMRVIILGLYLLIGLEAIYSGGLPLVEILRQTGGVTYADFGIPSLHVLIITFKNFYLQFLFYWFLRLRERRLLYGVITLLAINALIVNRADLLWNLLAMFVVWLTIARPRGGYRIYLGTTIVVLGIFYLFGVLGNFRSAVAFGAEYGNDFIYSIGQATDDFRDSIIPGEFFWAYLYISSPLANLQHTVTMYASSSLDYLTDIPTIFATLGFGGLPDFLSKRLLPELGFNAVSTELLVDNLNVCTMYNGSFALLGYLGMALQFLLLVLVVSVLAYLCRRTPYAPIMRGVLVVTCTFAVFSNTVTFSGWLGQCFYLVLLANTKVFYGFLYTK